MTLAPELRRDTLPLIDTEASIIRVSRDTRWPWLILVPKGAEVSEMHDLQPELRRSFLDDINRSSEILQQVTICTSINIAMLGNVVSSLHCHVIARAPEDPGWPGPVWGHGEPVWRDDNTLPGFASQVRARFSTFQ
mgnify:CR=1 FL=1